MFARKILIIFTIRFLALSLIYTQVSNCSIMRFWRQDIRHKALICDSITAFSIVINKTRHSAQLQSVVMMLSVVFYSVCLGTSISVIPFLTYFKLSNASDSNNVNCIIACINSTFFSNIKTARKKLQQTNGVAYFAGVTLTKRIGFGDL